MADKDPTTGRPVKRSTGWFGWNTIYGRDSDKGTPYMTRIWIGRLRLHVFHHADSDPDPHDHPWDFWTFPLTSYVEEVTTQQSIRTEEDWNDFSNVCSVYRGHLQVVPAFRLNFRPATHCHRVLGSYSGEIVDPFGGFERVSAWTAAKLPADRFVPLYQTPTRRIITLVWRSGEYRQWGFLKYRDGRWCWQHWKEYVLGGGKNAPCE